MGSSNVTLCRLEQILGDIGTVAVAVSGGVDSMTLSVVAGRILGRHAWMVHAVSPAVPESATRRVRQYAARESWTLTELDAGEFDDPRYRANPVDRCFYCKNSLYAAVRGLTDLQIVSGTNLDDLDDFRPGLEAARAALVRHPYVEAGIDKRGVRTIARELGLGDLADLPPSPCLSSRVQTGLRIEPRLLRFVDRAEEIVREALGSRVVRARIRDDRIDIELGNDTLERLTASQLRRLGRSIEAMSAEDGLHLPVSFAAYRRGSAFLHAERHA